MTFITVRLLFGGDHSFRGDHPSRGDQSGQGLAEYALILALIAVLSIVALTFLGGSVNTLLSSLGNAL